MVSCKFALTNPLTQPSRMLDGNYEKPVISLAIPPYESGGIWPMNRGLNGEITAESSFSSNRWYIATLFMILYSTVWSWIDPITTI